MVRLRTTSHVKTPEHRLGRRLGLWLWALTCLNASVAAATTASALSIAPSQYWEGNDGPWSTFPILAGTPAQNSRVLISTAATATWVVAPEGCTGSGIPSNCSSTRGSIFNRTASTTFQDNGPWNLGIEANLGTNYAADEGEFGWDTVGLGFQGSGGPSLNHTVLANLQTMDFYVGMLGLNPRPTNFTDLNDPQASYLNLLWLNGHIPSLSYSYTAGAQYRNNGVLGSLTLGGYDTSLFEQNGASFSFFSDQSRDLTVALKSITGSGGQTLLPTGILSFIDTTVSQIWLPIEACNLFESTFGLVYDTETQLYLVNDTQHTALQKQNASLTFTISPALQGATDINITFPYAAFDLEVSYPLVNTTQRYFPLKRADNDTQYTLGRTFLQEAYLTADYGRSNFSVSQRTWSLSPKSNIVNIIPANETITVTTSGNGTTSGTESGTTTKSNTGTIAGAAIGGVAVVALIGFGIWFMLRTRNRKAEEKKSADLAMQIKANAAAEAETKKDAVVVNDHDSHDAESLTPPEYKYELDTPGSKTPEMHGDSHFQNVEMDAGERIAELADPNAPVFELEAPHGVGELLSPLDARARSDREGLPSQMNSPRSVHTATTGISPMGSSRSLYTGTATSSPTLGNVVDIHASQRSQQTSTTLQSQQSWTRSSRSQRTETTGTASSRPFSWDDRDIGSPNETPGWI